MKDNTAWMRVYDSEINSDKKMSYVTADGNYGSDKIVVFPFDTLTERQWEYLSECSDYDRINYITAILNGEDLSEWEWEED